MQQECEGNLFSIVVVKCATWCNPKTIQPVVIQKDKDGSVRRSNHNNEPWSQ